jgi:SAM-dependent methyltransferase
MTTFNDNEKSEFDNFAESYKDELNHPIRNITGGEDDIFLKIKAEWFLRHLQYHPFQYASTVDEIKLLDYGCGNGGFLRSLKKLNFTGEIEGCDISRKMLEEAAKLWNSSKPLRLHLILDHCADFLDNTYDVIAAVCVFHHISPQKRIKVLEEIHRILKPNGRFFLFEHNPINPLTQWIVRQTPLDKNAVLLNKKAVFKLVKTVGFKPLDAAYFLFFPPRIMFLRKLEPLIAWLPLGGQFVVVAEK